MFFTTITFLTVFPSICFMISSEDTLTFAPVSEEQTEGIEAAKPPMESAQPEKEAPVYTPPREIEVKPTPRIVPRKKLEIIRVSQL